MFDTAVVGTAAERLEAAQEQLRAARAKLRDLDAQAEVARADYRKAVMLANEAEVALREVNQRPDPRHYRASPS